MSTKYGLSPEITEEKSINDNKFKDVYDFDRLIKVKKDIERREKSYI